uniref:Uncharacterized protein n=1 Tax=Arundo donax TaxID=35708 RepID=A0A0A8YT03_ARUDO
MSAILLTSQTELWSHEVISNTYNCQLHMFIEFPVLRC